MTPQASTDISVYFRMMSESKDVHSQFKVLLTGCEAENRRARTSPDKSQYSKSHCCERSSPEYISKEGESFNTDFNTNYCSRRPQ